MFDKQVVAKQSELFEDIRIYRVYNDENDDSIVKEEKDELNLDIEKNITEQVVEQDKEEETFELEQEPIEPAVSENKDTEGTDGNQ